MRREEYEVQGVSGVLYSITITLSFYLHPIPHQTLGYIASLSVSISMSAVLYNMLPLFPNTQMRPTLSISPVR